MIKVISLNSYGAGYKGFIEEQDKYVFFILSRKGELKKLQNYYKKDYTSYEHFVEVLCRFAPRSFFLKEPLYVESMSIGELGSLNIS